MRYTDYVKKITAQVNQDMRDGKTFKTGPMLSSDYLNEPEFEDPDNIDENAPSEIIIVEHQEYPPGKGVMDRVVDAINNETGYKWRSLQELQLLLPTVMPNEDPANIKYGIMRIPGSPRVRNDIALMRNISCGKHHFWLYAPKSILGRTNTG